MTNRLAEAIAEVKGIDPLEPGFSLYDSVDPDALEDFFASASGTQVRTEFRVAGVTACVYKTAEDEVVVTASEPEE